MIAPVFILFGILSILFLGERRYSKPNIYIMLAIFVVMLLIITFRDINMPDAGNYIKFFQGDVSRERFEVIFALLSDRLRNISANYLVPFAVIGAISLFIKFRLIRNVAPFFYGSMLVYLSNFFILHDMIQIRAGVAASFLLFAVKYIEERNLTKFIFAVILAIGFHNSAFIIIPLWFLPKFDISRSIWLCIIPVCYILAFSGLRIGALISYVPIDSIQQSFVTYTNLAEHGVYANLNILNIKILSEASIAMYLIYHADKIKPYFPAVKTWLKVYTVGFVIYILCSDLPIVSGRLGDYIRVVEIITIPLVALTFRPTSISKLLVVVIALSLLIIITYYNGYLI